MKILPAMIRRALTQETIAQNEPDYY